MATATGLKAGESALHNEEIRKFLKIYDPSTMDPNLKIPQEFNFWDEERIPPVVTLKNKYGYRWKVRVEEIDGYLWFTTGWKGFSSQNYLKEEETLIFEKEETSRLFVEVFDREGLERLDVYMNFESSPISGFAEPDPPTSQNCKQLSYKIVRHTNISGKQDMINKMILLPDYNNRAESSDPMKLGNCFKIVIQNTHFVKKYLPIPREFWRTYASFKNTPADKVKVSMGARSWKVGIKQEAYRTKLKENVTNFLEDNGLVVGTTLMFRLHEYSDLTFVVTVVD